MGWLLGLIAEALAQGAPRVECRSAIHPIQRLHPLGTWRPERMDHIGARGLRRSSMALCLCACVTGLAGEDLLQRRYRRDRVVLARIATHLEPRSDTQAEPSVLPSVSLHAIWTGQVMR